MKLMSIDYGRSRIGVAVAVSESAPPRGLDTIDLKRYPSAVDAVMPVIAREAPDLIGIGLPLGIDDGETLMSAEVREFAAQIGTQTGIAIRLVDESYSSIRAQELLRFRKKKDRRDKRNIDRVAACLILQTLQEELQNQQPQ